MNDIKSPRSPGRTKNGCVAVRENGDEYVGAKRYWSASSGAVAVRTINDDGQRGLHYCVC